MMRHTGRSAPSSQRGDKHQGTVACSLCFVTLCLLWLSACANLGGPDYKRPDAPGKAAWSDDPGKRVSAQTTIQPEWWTFFGDPYLDELIKMAISGNIDIRILAARTGVAQATISQARAGLLPTLTAGASTDTFKSTGTASTTKYALGSEVTWEVDIWGKVRKGVEAQQAEFRATEADWRAGYLTLVADVANAYFQIRQFDQQIDQQRKALERNQQILAIYDSLYAEGLIANTAVLQQQAEINRLQNGLLELQRLRKLTENGLATLLGVPADELVVPKAHLLATLHPVEVPAGLPSDLLSRRPDIVAAEYRVLQVYNLEGQARLARLPSVGLTGRGGTASFALSDLLKTWTFGLSSLISIPIFDPNVSAQIKISEAQTKVVQEEYRRTVISAFEEVENALTNLASHKAQKIELHGRSEKLAIVSGQVHAQLDEGMVSQLEVFEVERTLLDAEQEMLANYWQILTDTVALFKALGGGWPAEVVGNTDRVSP